jgi:hypothetical protein
MKKLYLLMIALSIGIVPLFSQAYEGTTQYDKKKQPAILIEYAYPAEAVENAFIKKMEMLGYKVKEEKGILNRDKGFLIFKNAYITDISQDRFDYIVKAERKSRKEDDESVLYLIIQKDDENAINEMDAYDVGRAKTFLNNLLPDIEAAKLELDIKAQEESLAKAEKKLKELQEDKINLERKLANNAKDQDQTIRDIDSMKQTLINLQGKRKQ